MAFQLLSIVTLIVITTVSLAMISSIAAKAAPHTPPASAIAAIVGMDVGALIVSAILWIVGAVLFGLMLRRLPDEEGVERGFKTAGLLYILGIVIPLLFLVAAILIYHDASVSLKRLA